MKRTGMGTRIVLVVLLALLALLALPLAPTASPVAAKNRSRTVSTTFANTGAIKLPAFNISPAAALLYPSPIAVSELKGKIRDVNLRLNGLQHPSPRDLEALLVGPRGTTAIVMANVGQGAAIAGVTLTLDDEAAAPLPDQAKLQTGTFRPANATGRVIAFSAPAPAARANAALSVFDGASPNGTWRLFVQDEDGPLNPGNVAGGWELEITTKVKAKKKKR